MSVILTVNGSDYFYPENGDVGWGAEATAWAQAITNGTLQKSGGLFQLLGEVDFGGTYGIKSTYFKSKSADIASVGSLRLSNTDQIAWRNVANSADLVLGVNASNQLEFNGSGLQGTITVADTSKIDLSLVANELTANIVAGSLVNADISASAAVAYSKLDLTGAILNADISGSAAIAYSKLNLSNSIVNADISGSAAIAYSKLNLSSSIVNADVAAGAAIARSKLANGSNSHVVINDGSGVMSSEATLAKSRGGTGADNSSVTFPSTGTIVTEAGVQALTLKDFDGGTASNTSRLTIPKNTKANLDALTRKEGTLVYATDQDKPYYDDGTILIEVGSGAGGGGGINYITNPDAEQNANDWGTYKAGTTQPTGVTTGTANLSWARSTTTPLRGDADFNLTKANGLSGQGSGVYTNFTIDNADQAKVLKISFDYEIIAGTFSGGTASTDSDLTVWVWDVTNGVLIQPSAYKMDGSVAGVKYLFNATFQTASNSTSYRLYIHLGTTTANNFVLAYDNFQVGPQLIDFGAPVTDFSTAGAPTTIANAPGTMTKYVWRRVGDSMEVRFLFTLSGAVTGTMSLPLPSGYTIDTGKLSNSVSSQNLGNITAIDQTGNFYTGAAVYDTTTAVRFNGSNTSGNWGATIPFTWASPDIVSGTILVPILGWGSSVSLSQADTQRAVALSVTLSSGTHATSGSWLAITSTFATPVVNTHGTFSSGVFTVPVAGFYKIDGVVAFTANATGIRSARILVDSTPQTACGGTAGYVGDDNFCNYSYLLQLNAGQTIGLQAYQNSGGSLAYTAATRLNIERMTSGQTIAASETISARYTTTAGQSIPNGATPIIDYGTKVFDTHGAVTTGASWKFTCPAPGKFDVSAKLGITGSWTLAQPVRIYIFKNGSVYSQWGAENQSSASYFLGMQINDTVDCVAGDTIDIRVSHSESSPRNLTTTAGFATVAINRIGSSS